MQFNDYRNYHPYRLTPRQRKFLKLWEKRREIPRWKYILFHGVLREGLVSMLIIKLLQFAFDPSAFGGFYFNAMGIIFFVLEICFWFGGGGIIGWFKHRSFETEYEMLKSMEHF
ncbi:MAG: hypothetical protein K2Q24_17020 [Chitinophagaceae bacterium]|nr:hypothetical protein [Chitinophagaceae bacterium]